MKDNYTAIDTTTYCASQSWYYTEVRKYGDDLVRVEVKRNAYDHQSYIALDKWVSIGWQTMIMHPVTGTPVENVSYTGKDDDLSPFANTCKTMWTLYTKIVNA